MGYFGFRFSGRADALASFLEAPVFQPGGAEAWRSFGKTRELPDDAEATFRLPMGLGDEGSAESQVENARKFLEDSETQLAALLATKVLGLVALEFSWEVPGDGFARALTFPPAMTEVCGRLGIEIAITAFVVEGRAFEG
ncbi:MAG: hypothetical protein ACI97A_003939 [Planctomycetota bacterium]|jgi:hypothetical protein